MAHDTTYRFRIRFFNPQPGFVDSNDEAVEIQLPNGLSGTLSRLSGGESVRDADWLTLTVSGLPTEEVAWAEGRRVRHSLHLWAVASGRPLALGNDEATGRFSDEAKENLEARSREEGHDVKLYDNVHGLDVQPEHPYPLVLHTSATATVTRPGITAYELGQRLGEWYDMDPTPSPEDLIAYDLYLESRRAGYHRYRFLLLIMAVDALCSPADRGAELQGLIDSLVEVVSRSTVEGKDALLGGLNNLRSESLGRRAHDLINMYLAEEEYGGRRAVPFFKKCYRLRSSVIHDGRPERDNEVLSLLDPLDQLVRDLLLKRGRTGSGATKQDA